MPGYHGHNIQDISIQMMVEFATGSAAPGSAARTHYHSFEEAYYFVSGSAITFLDGDRHEVSAGDIVWCSTNGTHRLLNQGTIPVRFIKCQAPIPPTSHAFFFPDDWHAISGGSHQHDAKGDARFHGDETL